MSHTNFLLIMKSRLLPFRPPSSKLTSLVDVMEVNPIVLTLENCRLGAWNYLMEVVYEELRKELDRCARTFGTPGQNVAVTTDIALNLLAASWADVRMGKTAFNHHNRSTVLDLMRNGGGVDYIVANVSLKVEIRELFRTGCEKG